MAPPPAPAVSPRHLLQAFLQLGVAGFGGPAAHVGLMEEVLVRRRGWLAREEFLGQYATVQLLPGPTSTILALVLGRHLGGAAGYWMAAVGFVLPAVLATFALAVAWRHVASDALVAHVRAGLAAAVVALLAVTTWRLGRGLVRQRWQLVVAVLTALASVAADRWAGNESAQRLVGELLLVVVPAPPPTVGGVFTLFLFIGATLIGSGYALIGWLGSLAGTWLGWLSAADLLDAVAAGYLTPGPLFATATFAGYRIGGWPAAAAATVGVFLPAFGYAFAAAPLSRWLEGRVWRRLLRAGLAAACVGLIASSVVPFLGVMGMWGWGCALVGVALLASGRWPPLVAFLATGIAAALLPVG